MISLLKRKEALLLLAMAVILGGCKKAPPPVIAASGTVTINGQPLPNAEVKFIPLEEGLDGNFSATGITDKDGAFTLALPGQTESGCCACECKVTINEGPYPDEARKESDEAVKIAMKFKASLTNRPIPDDYKRIGKTPLTYQVSEEQSKFAIEIER